MNQLILTPTDVLQLRDARPMEGSLAGHTMNWPTPDLVAHALRAALHRSGLACHVHCYHPRGKARDMDTAPRIAKYGSVLHAGPFPVKDNGGGKAWYFPCPLDVELNSAAPTMLPVRQTAGDCSSLPKPLCYTVASLCAPSKENRAPAWFSAEAWEEYAKASAGHAYTAPEKLGVSYADVVDTELRYGIALDDATGAVQDGRFYSAESLRLKPGWHLGSLVHSGEKDGHGSKKDVLEELFRDGGRIVVGGQQRVCTARLSNDSPLPIPLSSDSMELLVDEDGKSRIKWVLLTPAVWSRHGSHPGGWLPSWVDAETGAVLLQGGDRTRGEREKRADWRTRLKAESEPIHAKLVAAVVGKPQVVSGYAVAGRLDGGEGPKTTHSAVPAGSVYYFECDSPKDALRLYRALHCSVDIKLIRRSELLGEQGYGIGICASWHFADFNN